MITYYFYIRCKTRLGAQVVKSLLSDFVVERSNGTPSYDLKVEVLCVDRDEGVQFGNTLGNGNDYLIDDIRMDTQ